MIQIQPIHPIFGAEVLNLDLSKPESDSAFEDIRDALHEYALLLFRSQSLSPKDIVRWSGMFGKLEVHSDSSYLLEDYPEILVIGNLVEDGKVKSLFVNAAIEWHYDYAQAEQPAISSLLYAVEVPPAGGETLFADARAAYDALDNERKSSIDTLHAVYSFEYLDRHLRSMDPSRPVLSEAQRKKWPPVKHLLVQPHSVTGRSALLLSPELIMGIEGYSLEDSQRLIDELMAHVTNEAFVYEHRWRKGDLVIHDNRSLIHTATPFDTKQYLRIMYRTTIMP